MLSQYLWLPAKAEATIVVVVVVVRRCCPTISMSCSIVFTCSGTGSIVHSFVVCRRF
jgi:hypothetical protein